MAKLKLHFFKSKWDNKYNNIGREQPDDGVIRGIDNVYPPKNVQNGVSAENGPAIFAQGYG